MKNFIRQLSGRTQGLLVASLVLIVYGYACRAFGLYFFWESSALGWLLLLVGIISLLLDRIRRKEAKKEKAVLERIGIGGAAFLLLIRAVLFLVLCQSDAYAVAKTSLATDKKLTEEIGTVKEFGMNATGAISVATDSTGEHGEAVLQLIAKGTKQYKDVKVYVAKQGEASGWQVENVE